MYAPEAKKIRFDVPNGLQAGRTYAVSTMPVKLGGEADLKAWNSDDSPSSHKASGIVIPNGANFSVVDLSPGGSSQMHQTVSLDLSICVIGTIKHELDSGEIVTLNPGVSFHPQNVSTQPGDSLLTQPCTIGSHCAKGHHA